MTHLFTNSLTMAYNLLRMAEERWRRLNGYWLLPLVRTGARFIDGVPDLACGIRRFSSAA